MQYNYCMNGAVVLLAVNNMGQLSFMSVDSILRNTSSPIYVGYIRESDIAHFPKSQLLNFINLNQVIKESNSSEYADYADENFFDIVRAKWTLIEQVLMLNSFDFVVYSDLDVVWYKDITNSIGNRFTHNSSLSVIVQDNSPDIDKTILCMGLLGVRNSDCGLKMLAECRLLHLSESAQRDRVGDDEIVTKYFQMDENSRIFALLPQAAYPTGNLASLRNKKPMFPGLYPHELNAFHSNYVVGLHKKILLQYLAAGRDREVLRYFSLIQRISFRIELLLRRIKQTYLKFRYKNFT